MRKASSFMCVLKVLLLGGAEAARLSPADTLVGVLASSLIASASAWESCKPFKEIYANGQELCEVMFGGTTNGQAFKYETDEAKAYTMWWFGTSNPNDAVSTLLGKTTPDTCELEYFHKSAPSPEGPRFTECHPWKESSCCHNAVTETPEKMNKAYGAGYEWDRCGPLSQSCERFFVQEACLYECSPNAGLYRRFSDAEIAACEAAGHTALPITGDGVVTVDGANYTCTGEENSWEMWKMPIKASYCDAWYRACAEDYFCGTGNYFSCANDYHTQLEANATAVALELERLRNQSKYGFATDDDDSSLPGWAIGVIVACGIVLLLFCIFLAVIIRKEKAGAPIFSNLTDPATEVRAKPTA